METPPILSKVITSVKGLLRRSFENRFWDWQAALLTIMLVQISSARLTATNWAPFLYFTQTISFLGTILGLALGYSTYNRRSTVYAILGYTAMLLPLHWLNAAERTESLSTDLLMLAARILTSLALFLRSEPVYDPLFFVVIVSIGFWIIGLWAGYNLTRHRDYLDVVLPSGLAMLIVQIFDPDKSIMIWGLALYIFVALILLGRLYFLENQETWKKNRSLVTPETIKDISNGVLLTAFIAVAFTWSLPNLISGIKPAAQAWNRLTRPIFDRLSDATTALEGDGGSTTAVQTEFYGSEISLGLNAAAGDTPVFYVQQEESEFVPLRYYWRGRVYDLYINGRWTNSPTVQEEFFPASDTFDVEYPDKRYEMQLTFTNNFDAEGLIYAPAEMTWINRKSSMFLIKDPANTGNSMEESTAWVVQPILEKGDKYSVRVLISDPTIEDLRNAGGDYPVWVTNKYLQVPENIAPRLKNLAETITASQDTAYDKTMAITNYLRNEIEYSPVLEKSPPQNVDPVLWVLFDYKKGFCMYYASAEVLMLRSVGIPARMAVGFAEGIFNEDENRYVVTRKDAHAWPEVYFPGIGWVEFEPTGNQFPLERAETNAAPVEGDQQPGAPLQEDSTVPTPVPVMPQEPLVLNGNASGSLQANTTDVVVRNLLLGLFFAALVFIIYYMRRNTMIASQLPAYLSDRLTRYGATPPRWLKNWTRWAALSDVERSFNAVNLSLYWLGHPQPSHMPSTQRAKILIKNLPDAEKEITTLLNEYQATLYTPRKGNPQLARSAAYKILLKSWRKRLKESLDLLNHRYNQLQ